MFWRRTLPHWVPENSTVFVTWRLAGTLPHVPELYFRDPNPGRTFVHHDRRLDRAETGPRWLANPGAAQIVAEALIHGHEVRNSYNLLA
jgi:hypothetical protein